MFVDIGLKFYAFTTHLSDLEVKVIDFDKFSGKAQVRRASLSCDISYLDRVFYYARIHFYGIN